MLPELTAALMTKFSVVPVLACCLQARVLNGIRWLHLASGGWVRERHPDHMSMRFPDKPEVEGK